MALRRSLDIWGLLAVVAAAVALTLTNGPAAVRLPLGLLAVLLAPGYALVAALFPRAATFDIPERLGVSIAASLALVSLLGLVLSFSPWGLTRESAVYSISLTVLPLTVVALARAGRLPSGELPGALYAQDAREWVSQYPRQVWTVGLALAVITAVLAATLAFNPPPASTEFFALGPEGLARDYPREATVGQPVAVTVAITNHERHTQAYRIEVRDGSQVLATADTGTVANEATVQVPLTFTPAQAADPRAFDVLLFAGGQPTPYRSLQLLIPVRPAASSQAESNPASAGEKGSEP